MPDTLVVLLWGVIISALVFDFINGFHDTANAIATVVSTRVLSPTVAILLAAGLNFFGAFFNAEVAKTIGKGIVAPGAVTQLVIFSGLIAAIFWNLLTWYFGIPSSSSHALIGGLMGGALLNGGLTALNIKGVTKIFVALVTSPVIGFAIGFVLMLILIWVFWRMAPAKINSYYRKLQIVSASFFAYSHGSNDAQKSMGIITLAIFAMTGIPGFIAPEWFEMKKVMELHPPFWVIISCATVMAIGTSFGGWRIIKTMGTKIIKLQPIHGFAAETSASIVILLASHFGLPVSTTHVISGSIMGVGASKKFSAVKWGVAGNIVMTWVLTIPVCALLAFLIHLVLGLFIKA